MKRFASAGLEFIRLLDEREYLKSISVLTFFYEVNPTRFAEVDVEYGAFEI